jgi:hypothetical protein
VLCPSSSTSHQSITVSNHLQSIKTNNNQTKTQTETKEQGKGKKYNHHRTKPPSPTPSATLLSWLVLRILFCASNTLRSVSIYLLV